MDSYMKGNAGWGRLKGFKGESSGKKTHLSNKEINKKDSATLQTLPPGAGSDSQRSVGTWQETRGGDRGGANGGEGSCESIIN